MADSEKKNEREGELTISQPSTFTPIHPFDMANPKSWGPQIGMMNWDNDKIVFSKRSLLEFLRSMDITVNQNFSEVQKLPKYATFGKFSQAATDAAVADLVDAEIADPTHDSTVDPSKSTVPRPTRKVIDPPGGKSSGIIIPEEYEEHDALSLAPPRDGGDGVDVEVERMERMRLHVEPTRDGGATIEEEKDLAPGEAGRVSNPPADFKPTRKVRHGPGGPSTIGDLFGGGDAEEDQAAVRDAPGRKRQDPTKQNETGFW